MTKKITNSDIAKIVFEEEKRLRNREIDLLVLAIIAIWIICSICMMLHSIFNELLEYIKLGSIVSIVITIGIICTEIIREHKRINYVHEMNICVLNTYVEERERVKGKYLLKIKDVSGNCQVTEEMYKNTIEFDNVMVIFYGKEYKSKNKIYIELGCEYVDDINENE